MNKPKTLLFVAVIGGLIAGICTPNLIEARKNGNETSAVGALKTLGTAQSLYREADKAGDGGLDYGAGIDISEAVQTEPNPFREPEGEDALSTFSIDVDTASYSVIRRYLQNGQLPPTHAVRVEEMINYFHYETQRTDAEAPVSATIEAAACPWQDGHRLVRIGLKAREIEAGNRPPTNLVFLIDVSGSMAQQDKLPLVVESINMLVEQLDARDRVAIVAYAGGSNLVLPSTPGDQRARIRDALERLQACGSTNGGAGIQLAYRKATENFIAGGANRVILATDGDFNVGISDRRELEGFIAKKAESGVFLTVLGYGMSYQDATLETLADRGNGQYAYVSGKDEARKVLVEELTGTLITVAKDVKVQVAFDPDAVRSYRLIGYENRVLENREFADDSRDAGDMGAGHTVTALYQVEPQGTPRGRLLTLKLRYKEPISAVSREQQWEANDAGTAFADASSDLRFAAAVAEFGMLLRRSPHAGDATYDHVLQVARQGLPADAEDRRGLFCALVEIARRLSAKPPEVASAPKTAGPRYGTLKELGEAGSTGLIDSVLASGTKNGYLFKLRASPTHPEFMWMASASPALPKTTGDRWFVTNHEGVTYYSTQGEIPLNDECKIPAGLQPVGR